MQKCVRYAAWVLPIGLVAAAGISGLARNQSTAGGTIQRRPSLAPLWLRLGDPMKPDNGNQVFGTAAAFGDVDGDGFDEVAVGAPSGGMFGARVYLFRNADFQKPWFSAPAFGYSWGSSVAIDDVDGDGLGDLISVDGANGAMGIYRGPVNVPKSAYPDSPFRDSRRRRRASRRGI